MIGLVAKDLLRKLLVKDPHKRLGSGPRGAEDIKAHPFFKVLPSYLPFFLTFPHFSSYPSSLYYKPYFCITAVNSLWTFLNLRNYLEGLRIFSWNMSLLTAPSQGLNWSDLAQKKVPSPFKPELKSELDVGNFAEEFTGMDPVYSPASTPPSTDRLFQVSPHLQLLSGKHEVWKVKHSIRRVRVSYCLWYLTRFLCF